MEYTQILYEKRKYLATITLNRPEKLNALTDLMLQEVKEALSDADRDDEIRVIVLTGAGRAFSAGFDLSVSKYVTAQDWRGHITNGNGTFRAIWDTTKPVIAKVNGFCLGGAFDMSLACDVVIASETAKMGEPDVLFGGTQMYMMLPFMTDMRVVKNILLRGENFSARQMLEWNLVNEVVAPEELDAAVAAYAKRLATLPIGTPQLNKTLINRIYDMMGLRQATDVSTDVTVYALTRKKSEESMQFYDRVSKDGLKAALKWRNDRFEE